MTEAATKVQVVRSARRSRTISARWQGETLVVTIPATFSPDEEQEWVARMLKRATARREQQALDDEALARRAAELNRRYFEGKLRVSSVRWVSNQTTRYGSCTPADGTIRISHVLARMPAWVRDYVLVHELAHLVEPNHSRRFWRLVNRYPLAERARGYLIAKGLEEDGTGEG